MSESKNNELIQSIHNLSDDISDIVIREQQVMNDDLDRMSNMLREAARNLRECFSAMSNQLAQQSAELRTRSAQAKNDTDIQNLLSTTNEISSHVGNAVRALQFEDILQQLIGHSRLRASEIEKMFVTMHQQVEGLYESEDQDNTEIMSVLKKCQEDIEAVRDALNLSNPVKQESLDKGDVELF